MADKINTKGTISCNWQDIKAVETAVPGITQRVLWEGLNGKRVEVFEFAAGAIYPGLDIHEPGPEQVYVISGDLSGDGNTYRTGDFVHYPAGTSHIPRSENGCVLLVNFPEG